MCKELKQGEGGSWEEAEQRGQFCWESAIELEVIIDNKYQIDFRIKKYIIRYIF